VAKLKKKKSIPDIKISKKIQQNTQGFEKLSKTDQKLVKKILQDNFSLNLSGKFFTYRDEVYYAEKYDETIWKNFFLYKC